MTSTLLLTGQILLMAAIVAGLASLRPRYGRALLFTFLGATQYVQTLWATSVYVTLFGSYTVSPGSIVLFAGSLFAVLLVYVISDVADARALIYGIVLANMALIVLTWTMQIPAYQVSVAEAAGQPAIDLWGYFIGTVILAIEAVAVIVAFESFGRFRVPLAIRLTAALSLILGIDAVLWAVMVFSDQQNFREVLVGQIVGKLYAGVLYGMILTIIVERFRRVDPQAAIPDASRDVFGILQYRQRFQQAEIRRRDMEQRFTAILEATPDFVGIADGDGRILFLNRAGRTMTDFGETENLRDVTVADFLPDTDRDWHRSGTMSAARRDGSWTGESTLQAKSGRTVVVSQVILYHRATEATAEYFSTVARDITDAVQAARRLRENNAQLELAQRTARMGFVEWNLATDEVLLSTEALRLLKLPPSVSPLMPRQFADLVHRDDLVKAKEAIQQTVQLGTPYSLDHRMVASDGTEFWIHGQGELHRDEHGHALRVLGTMHDITDRIAMEAQLRQAGRLEVVGQLAGGIAHDFNNILTAILGTVELLTADLQVGGTALEDVLDIQVAAQRAATLTSQLLSFSRRQMLQPESASVRMIVNELDRMLRRLIGEHIQVVTDLGDGEWGVWADRSQLEQVLLNLAINARDAMPNGGTLTIRGREQTFVNALPVFGGQLPPGRWIMLSMADTGIGIPPDVLPHIFEPFYSTKGPGRGTGLGLASAYGFVTQSAGFITVDSATNRGTTFTIYLPAARIVTAPIERTHHHRTLGGTEHVMVVEDDEDVRRTVRKTLESRGYSVWDTGVPADALVMAEDLSQQIDLVITDLVMPDMHGVELAERLMLRRPSLPVLYMSGYPGNEGPRAVPPSGAVFIEKPFSPDRLTQAVRHAIDRTT